MPTGSARSCRSSSSSPRSRSTVPARPPTSRRGPRESQPRGRPAAEQDEHPVGDQPAQREDAAPAATADPPSGRRRRPARPRARDPAASSSSSNRVPTRPGRRAAGPRPASRSAPVAPGGAGELIDDAVGEQRPRSPRRSPAPRPAAGPRRDRRGNVRAARSSRSRAAPDLHDLRGAGDGVGQPRAQHGQLGLPSDERTMGPRWSGAVGAPRCRPRRGPRQYRRAPGRPQAAPAGRRPRRRVEHSVRAARAADVGCPCRAWYQ